MENSDIVVGLDIGTTKICAIVGMRTEHGKIEVLGMGKAESAGVSRGVVTNIEKTIKGIKSAIEEAALKSNCDISEVVVGIAGQHIKSLQHRGIIVRNSTEDEINRNDVDRLIEDMYRLAMPPGEKIIHVLPQEFTVDNEQGILEPIGMSGIRLEANFHVITGQITAANNIIKCIERANLFATDMVLEPLASADAVLSDEEKEAGVVLVDIGGGTSDIAIFYEGIIRHTAVIPFGGNSITEDIREGCAVMKNTAEALKVKFGSALADENKDEEVISIQGLKGREPKEVSVKNLAYIIQARMEEILEQVKYEIQASGFEKKIRAGAGIVVTGGGAQLKHITQLVEYITGIDARIGYPNEHLAKTNFDDIKSPMYSTGIGLVIKGLQYIEMQREKAIRNSKGITAIDTKDKPTPKTEREQKQGRSFLEGIIKKSEQFFLKDIENIDDKGFTK
ncbi:MAG: cell division protein FtsA [Sphingobacteriales bacterium]|jgi:cell division protein FtsA|nr:cell division protein FtsA [Sphingobacteriales bacterium]